MVFLPGLDPLQGSQQKNSKVGKIWDTLAGMFAYCVLGQGT